MYGEIEAFKNWVLADESTGSSTSATSRAQCADKLHAVLPRRVVSSSGFPSLEEGIPQAAARARILYIKSSLGHFPLVTGGIALPMVLRTLRAKRLLDVPLADLLETATEQD